MNDLVSIIMPSYNCGKFVEETIRSVQAQTYQNWEIIFVDDCSFDDTIRLVTQIKEKDDRIHLFQNIMIHMPAYILLDVTYSQIHCVLHEPLPMCQIDF